MKIKSLLLILMVSLIAACNQDVQTNASHSSAPTQAASYVAKPQAPVSMSFEVLNKAALGEVLDIKLIFKAGRTTEALKVVYHLPAGLTSVDAQSQFEFNKLAKGALESVMLKLIPEQLGQHNINITASIEIDGISQSAVFVVPVSLGVNQQLKTKQAIQSVEAVHGMHHLPEQNVISMPAAKAPAVP